MAASSRVARDVKVAEFITATFLVGMVRILITMTVLVTLAARYTIPLN